MAQPREADLLAQIDESIKLRELLKGEIGTIASIATAIAEAIRNGNRVYTMGNGGSAADAQHIAAELSGRFNMDRKSLPAEALTANTSTITALANDYGFESIFSHLVQGCARKGDILLGLSTGGNSENVVRAFKAGKTNGTVNIGFVGKKGGQLKEVSDLCLHVPSSNTARIQEMHLFCGHLICGLVEEILESQLRDESIKAIHPDMIKPPSAGS